MSENQLKLISWSCHFTNNWMRLDVILYTFTVYVCSCDRFFFPVYNFVVYRFKFSKKFHQNINMQIVQIIHVKMSMSIGNWWIEQNYK